MNHLFQLSNLMKDVNPTLAQFYIKEMLQVSEKAQLRVLVSVFVYLSQYIVIFIQNSIYKNIEIQYDFDDNYNCYIC